ncbi:RNA-binding protein [Naganishia cerealis]|uniref:RNA-binding protein n=1 Tax=Naganishia cerealis TaxID=610337 RepID=A0ACC2W6K0_9TREE|nr:RNA-binding protein [Naganishia cerealis]
MSYYDPFQNQQYMGQPYYPYYPQDGQQATNGNQPPIMQQPQWNYDQQYSEGYPQGAMGSDYYVDESSFNPVPMQLNMPYEASPFPSAPQNPMAQPSDVYGNPQGDNGSPAAPSRTVYLGNIPSDIEPNELLDYVRSGILESVKILPAKNCAFISFIDHQSALLFHSDCILKKLSIKGHDIRIGWGKNTPMLPAVVDAIHRDGATRNVYLGNLNHPITGETLTEQELREDLSTYGVIDSIKIIPEKGIAFIHFLSILSAIRCVQNLPLKEKYLDKKCFYGKDRCAFITKTQQHNAAQYLGLAPGMEHIVTAADREFISSALVQQSAAAAQIATQAGGANNLGNRTVYLGNLHQDSSVEEICNVVRGGLLQSIRFLKERHVCFITFIDPIAAAQFYAMCQLHGLTIHNRRIKVGWGKHSGPLSNGLSLAVSNGASRNIYVGNLGDFNYYNPTKLREDFSQFGDIEQINYLEEKNCAFINFVNIANAIKAIDGIKSLDDYKNLKINFGKDRCGNLPRQFQNHSSAPQSASEPRSSNTLSDNELMTDDSQLPTQSSG